MNIKRIAAYVGYYAAWCLIFYSMAMTTIVYSKDYNVNIVCLIVSLIFACVAEPIMRCAKRNIDEKCN